MLQWSQSSNLQVPFVLVKWISIMYKLLNLTTDLKTEDGFFYKKGIISLFLIRKGYTDYTCITNLCNLVGMTLCNKVRVKSQNVLIHSPDFLLDAIGWRVSGT